MRTALWLLDKLFGKPMERNLRQHLVRVSEAGERSSRDRSSGLLRELAHRTGPHVTLGVSDWGEPIEIPLAELLRLHGLVTGGSGSGKTMAVLLIVEAVLDACEANQAGCAFVDGAKSDLFLGVLYLIKRRLDRLAAQDPAAAARLRRRIRIIDFAATNVITPFNLLARLPDAEPDAFASHQVDLLLDVLPDGDALKLVAAPLKTLVQVLSSPEIGMSVIELIQILDDEALLSHVLARCRDANLSAMLIRQLGTLSGSTRAALRRRLEVLVSSGSVARMLGGKTVPDFRDWQDQACIVAVNCAGPNISGRLTTFLNTLIVSYFCRSIYARRNPEKPFVVAADEAQDLFASPVMREHLSDAGRLSRRYGTYFWFITQNLNASVPDARLLRLLQTNVGWSWSGRGDPADCAFLKPVLPVTGRRARAKREPFEETRFHAESEERSLVLDEISNLPNRTGYFWLRGQAAGAIRVRTADLAMPQGAELERAVLPTRNDPTIGQRVSRKDYERTATQGGITGHNRPADAAFTKAYQRGRSGGGGGS